MSTESSSTAGAAPTRRRRRTVGVAAGAAVAVAGAFALASTLGAPQAAAGELVAFDSCEALQGWYADLALADVGPYGLDGGMVAMGIRAEAGVDQAMAGAGAAPMPAQDGSALQAQDSSALEAGVGTSGTGTNVQEAGVDEPAVLKTDGELVYTVVGTELVVTDVTDGVVVGRVGLLGASGASEATGGELLLAGDRAVVLRTGWTDPAATSGVAGPIGDRAAFDSSYLPGSPTTVVTTVDVSDPRSPTIVGDLEVEGSYLSARAAGDTIRLVLSSTPTLPFVYPEQEPAAAGTDARAAAVNSSEATAEARNREVIENAAAQDWLPQQVSRGDDGTVTREPLLSCDQVAHPEAGAGLGTLTVLTLDPAAGVVTDTDAVSADGENVYASADRLYVATTAGGWFGGSDQPRTDLHGFDVSVPQQTGYVASGTVDGWLLGRWALSEHDGYLRVATTTSSPDPDGATASATQSSVHVLAELDGALAQVGRLDGLGPGESIRAVRWFDDVAVVVTFEQTDPLYTIDLADPAAPRVSGELKVTGYSAYLHPVGDGRLLGIGQEATLNGMTTGTKAEAFDLRDLAAPVSTGNVVWPDSSTAVEFDSRAFTYLPERSLAVFGIDFYQPYSEPLPLPEPLPESTPLPEPVPLPEPLPEPVPAPDLSDQADEADAVVVPSLPAPGLTAGYGPAVVALSLAADGSLSERGRWSADTGAPNPAGAGGYGDPGQVEATIVVGDVVAVRLVRWSQTDETPTTRLVLLDLDEMSPTAEVTL